MANKIAITTMTMISSTNVKPPLALPPDFICLRRLYFEDRLMIHVPDVVRHQRKRIDDKGILTFRDADVTILATAGPGGTVCPARVAAGGTALCRRQRRCAAAADTPTAVRRHHSVTSLASRCL
ncbi:MAG: hypothetical protein ABIG36_00225 [Pseudomonadota bacterium]